MPQNEESKLLSAEELEVRLERVRTPEDLQEIKPLLEAYSQRVQQAVKKRKPRRDGKDRRDTVLVGELAEKTLWSQWRILDAHFRARPRQDDEMELVRHRDKGPRLES